MAARRALEIAEASLALANELPARVVKTTHADVLVQAAKRLERLQAKRRKLRRELKQVDADIRFEKKSLRALVQQVGKGDDQ